MARGWESKSVEEQMETREETDSEEHSHRKLTPAELQLRTKRDGLHMVRTRTVTVLRTTRDPRYRAHLERVLADLDAQLSALDSAGNSKH